MIRLLFLLHRYLGIAVGLLMAMWCLSGLVMMYVSYPALDEGVRLSHLAPITWGNCCHVSQQALGDADAVGRFRIEMLAGRPVLDPGSGPDAVGLIDLTTGSPIDAVSAREAAAATAAYRVVANETPVAARLLGSVDEDQWTLEGVSADERPLFHFALGDARRTQLYVSSVTGRVVQLTTRAQRWWNWLGAIPHWLYFADLREHALLWSQVVIYTSLVGCFLTLTGLYIGARQCLRSRAGSWSPYRGFNLWHHLAGLFFGLFTLTWILSGLLSMNPWGWLEGGGAGAERARLRGPPPHRSAVTHCAAGARRGAPRGPGIDRGRAARWAAVLHGERRRGRAAPSGRPGMARAAGGCAAGLHNQNAWGARAADRTGR